MWKNIISGFILLFILSGCGEDDPLVPPDDHEEAEGVALYSGGELAASIFQGVPSDTLHASVDVTSELFLVRFLDHDAQPFDIEQGEKTFGWEILDPALVELMQDQGREGSFEFRLRGRVAGVTTVQFVLFHAGHVDYRSGAWPLRVH